MIFVIQVIFIFLVVKGIFLIVDYINKDPGREANRAFEKTVAAKQSLAVKLLDGIVMPLAEIVSGYIKFSEERSKELRVDLARADIALSPQLYYARAVVIAVVSLPLLFLIIVVGIPWLLPFAIILVGLVFYHFMTLHKDKLKMKKEKIEMGLPGFVRSILYKLNDNSEGLVKADLISIFEDYLKVANDVFRYDVSMLIMEMKSKDIETAIRNFNSRVSIPDVSFLCNALIGITRGERQNETLASLARDMDKKAGENIRRHLQRRPGKVMRACIPLVFVGILALVYVLYAATIGGLSKYS
ncbi:MAG: hypothetical protein PHE79_11665 [Eubacteriales bacterium]|nr:hypothetical protein [Eubacteriales bacterium]